MGGGEIVFVPAICPSCGGELQIPEGRDNVKCLYCGMDIVFQPKEKVDNSSQFDTYFKLATVAFEGKNFQEAYDYMNKALEINPRNVYAWLKKSLYAAALSTLNSPRFEESITCIKEAIRLGIPEESYLDMYLDGLAYFIEGYAETVREYLEKADSGVPRGQDFSYYQKLGNQFYEKYYLPILRAICFIWETCPDQKNAQWILSMNLTSPPRSFLGNFAWKIYQEKLDPILKSISENVKEYNQIIGEKLDQRYQDEEHYDCLVKGVLDYFGKNHYPDAIFHICKRSYYYSLDIDFTKGERVWRLVEYGKPEGSDETKEITTFLWIWLLYDENDCPTGFEIGHRNCNDLYQCGLSEQALTDILVKIEEEEVVLETKKKREVAQ